jgi:hypothetical protein
MQVEAALDRNYELFEAYCIRNVFSIPDGHIPEHLIECQQHEVGVGRLEQDSADDKELAEMMGELQLVLFLIFILTITNYYRHAS